MEKNNNVRNNNNYNSIENKTFITKILAKTFGIDKNLWTMKLDGMSIQEIKKVYKRAVREHGIPNQYRRKFWPLFSGAIDMQNVNKITFSDIMETMKDRRNEFYEQIELDVKRTFPNDEEFQKIGGPEKLKNVLYAFTWSNPNIGYTQSMNFWCGIFLLYLDEEWSFWMMKTLVENILPPDYYTKHMFGVLADSGVVMLLLETYLPRIHQLLCHYNINLTMMLPRWLLCLFVHILPKDLALRILDSLFLEGNKILLRAALTIFKCNESDLLKCDSIDKILEILLNPRVPSIDVFMSTMFDMIWLRGLSKEKIELLRKKELDKLKQEILGKEEKFIKKERREFKLLYQTHQELIKEITLFLKKDSNRLSKMPPYRPKSWRQKKTNTIHTFHIIDDYVPKRTCCKIYIM